MKYENGCKCKNCGELGFSFAFVDPCQKCGAKDWDLNVVLECESVFAWYNPFTWGRYKVREHKVESTHE